MADFTFQNLVPGYIDPNSGLFVALTSGQLTAGKGNLPRSVLPCIKGDIKVGPFDYASNGITDSNNDGIADDPLDATANQYLIPNQSLLVAGTHFSIKKASALTGGTVSTLLESDGTTPSPASTITITTAAPGQLQQSGVNPENWYAIIDPKGSGADLDGGTFIEVSLNPTLPYSVALLPRRFTGSI